MNTRDRLKQIGLSLFARHGYEATTLAQIASAAGIKKPSIYNHFDSKAALFLELSRDADDDMIALIDASLAEMADAPFEQRLRHLLQQCATFAYREHQGVFYKRFLLFPPHDLVAEAEAITEQGESRIDRRLLAFVQAGHRAGALRETLADDHFIAAFYCVIDGLLSETFMYERPELERRFEGVWSVFWTGVKAG
ncbi:MAG: TetR/AcrR family transcriptional regulator [Salinicola sp.]|uniref:TetR/AcrR family transcriptional regulator n=1 Tax=Salinicola sp. TaxID=1978524 RepID=UPI001D5806BD|nr:TetR/AcrR family transcriptional regulator [Salinicola sp.]NRB55333.1 TetR/AcrR family transcriptional regulator [Salinicola sp.]